jgi:hypothetical protein
LGAVRQVAAQPGVDFMNQFRPKSLHVCKL